MRSVLVIGVDPGTTVGWAALNKKGEVVSIGSRKGIALDELTALIREIGKVVIVGTDKAKLPTLVRSISAKFRAKTVCPGRDLTKAEKKALTNEEAFLNNHEKDALAAAKLAFKRKYPLFRKVKSYVKKYDKHNIEDKILAKVLKTNNSITAAVQEIEKKETVRVKEKKTIETKTKIETILRKENLTLRKMINKLQLRVRELDSKVKKNTKQVYRPKEHLFMQKDQIINNLRTELEKEKKALTDMKRKQKKLLNSILNIKGKQVINCLPNLGMHALEKIDLKKNEVLFVEDPNCFSEKAVEQLRELEVDKVIHIKPLTRKVRKILPFIFIPAKHIEMQRFGDLAFIRKKDLQQNKADIFHKVVEEYKNQRKL